MKDGEKSFYFRTCKKCGRSFYTEAKYAEKICYECKKQSIKGRPSSALPKIDAKRIKERLGK